MGTAEIFKGLRNANVFEKGFYLEPGGDFLLEVNRCIVKHTRGHGDAFIVEFKVLESNKEKNGVGTKVSWYQGIANTDVAWPAIKEFVYALLGKDFTKKEDRKYCEEKIDPKIETLVDGAVGDENNFKGMKIRVQTSSKVTKEKKVDFTVHTWRPE